MRDEYDFTKARANRYVLKTDVAILSREIRLGRDSGPTIHAALAHAELLAQFCCVSSTVTPTCNRSPADAESPK